MKNQCLLCQKQIDSQVSIQNILSIITHPDSNVCHQCKQQFNKLVPGCKICGKAGSFNDQRCAECLIWKQKGSELNNQSIYQYNDFMSEYMHRYKFQGDYRLRSVFKKEFSRHVKKLSRHRLVVPIPVSEETWHDRGFNQVTGWLDLKYEDVLMTNKMIRQSRSNRSQRLSLSQPFSIHPDWSNKIANHDILLVDDVYTTGTTLHLAAQKLIEAGCSSVISFTLSR